MKGLIRRSAYILAALVVLAPFLYFSAIYYQSYTLLRDIRPCEPGLATRLYDVNGELISELYDENRSFIGVDRLPGHVSSAFIATEDRDFNLHIGYDLKSIVRALIVDLFSGELRQGGSTITQQLVKHAHTKGERSFRRKIVELLIAQEYEKRYTKPQILEMYLNLIYFGHGCHGVDSAARFYFNTTADRLNVAQAAILASMTTAPNRASPLRNPAAAYARSRQVLLRMIDAGFIAPAELAGFDSYWRDYLGELKTRYPTLGVRDRKKDLAPYFTEYMRQELLGRYGPEKVYRGGMKVYTTLDLRFQAAADRVMTEGLAAQNRITSAYNRNMLRTFDATRASLYAKQQAAGRADTRQLAALYSELRNELADSMNLLTLLIGDGGTGEALREFTESAEWFQSSGRAEGALVAIDPRTGGIRAMVGGSGFTAGNQLNRAVQARRQPGSAFKIFIYGAGIASRIITAATSFFDISTDGMEPARDWRPRNYDKQSRGLVRVRRAMALSLNTIPVRVYEKIGGQRIAAFASAMMGIPRERFQIDPTLALGTTEVTPLELARGAAVYASGGLDVVPRAMVRVQDRYGKIIDQAPPAGSAPGKRLISKGTAFIMTSLMREVVESGTASFAIRRVAGFRLPAAGKTGTNTAFRDAWFVGFTPALVAVVWVGCDIPRFSLGYGQSGASAAAPLWGRFMQEVRRHLPPAAFPSQPDEVSRARVCAFTGNRPVRGCPVADEFFLRGTEPRETCSGTHGEDDTI